MSNENEQHAAPAPATATELERAEDIGTAEGELAMGLEVTRKLLLEKLPLAAGGDAPLSGYNIDDLIGASVEARMRCGAGNADPVIVASAYATTASTTNAATVAAAIVAVGAALDRRLAAIGAALDRIGARLGADAE